MSKNVKKDGALNLRDQELVALGAAIASNCIPCIEYHVPCARRAGLNDAEIGAAVELAEKVRRIPADKVLQTAVALLEVPDPRPRKAGGSCGCGGSAGAAADDGAC